MKRLKILAALGTALAATFAATAGPAPAAGNPVSGRASSSSSDVSNYDGGSGY